VILARWQDGQLRFWCDDDPAHAWAYSSLRIAQRLIHAPAPVTAPEQQTEIERFSAALPGQGKWSVLLPLTNINGHWQGFALAEPRGKEPAQQKCWCYSESFGLNELDQEKGAE
jgi:CRISPR-associated endonuclease/helicase Cas3